ncbi:hypothetical protein NQ317_016127 [Molorchus minor]|uniref:Uncharacterized protein n=1 Tax=Molorchus minor TaxID=1323400 RepID=A0ABQ9J922_9CUCU|nr:hypothetical protein NQ317_016127 [Molorchus minor]
MVLFCPVFVPTLTSDQRRQLLNIVWKHIAALNNPAEYITLVALGTYVLQHFSTREVNTILGDIIDHMSVNRSYEYYYRELKRTVGNVVSHIQDFEIVGHKTNDPVVTNALMFLCSVLHDSVNALTPKMNTNKSVKYLAML